MNLLITFWNGDYSQFDEGGVKEIIFVNEYTLSHAIDEGYVM